MKGNGVKFVKKGKAEVTGLVGETNEKGIIVEHPEDLDKIDPSRPVVLFSQTTKSVDDFKKLTANIQSQSQTVWVEAHDTVCRQVSNRVSYLQQFAGRFEVVIFVGGRSSSNAKVLFDVCKQYNLCSYFVCSPADLKNEWFKGIQTVGVCGATSTPQWLMEKVAERINEMDENQ